MVVGYDGTDQVLYANDSGDVYAPYSALALTWNGSTWSIAPTPTLPPADLNGVACDAYGDNCAGGEVLNGVACTAGSCTAVGYDAPSSGPLAESLIEEWDGTAWSVDTSPSVVPENELQSVSCLDASDCVAAGFYNPGPTNQTLVETTIASGEPPAGTPEVGSAILLPSAAAVLFAVAIYLRRRRSAHAAIQ
jgi:hypothetical protein